MTELKCPFCQQEAYITKWESANSEAYCSHCDTAGDLKLWQALIDTKKKLDIAVDALKKLTIKDESDGGYFVASAKDTLKIVRDALHNLAMEEYIEQINNKEEK